MFNINNLKVAPINRVMELVESRQVNAVLTLLSKVEMQIVSEANELPNSPVFDYKVNVGKNEFEGIEKYIKPEDWLIVPFEDYEGGEPTEIPTEAKIKEAISFGIKKLDEGKKLLVHCQMGMSRSPAIAYLIMCHYMDPQDAINNLYKIRQGIKPNMFIIEMGDKVMGLGGKAVFAYKNRTQVQKEMNHAFGGQVHSLQTSKQPISPIGNQ